MSSIFRASRERVPAVVTSFLRSDVRSGTKFGRFRKILLRSAAVLKLQLFAAQLMLINLRLKGYSFFYFENVGKLEFICYVAMVIVFILLYVSMVMIYS